MVVEQVNFQLLIPHSLIKACSQLVGEAQFEVGGFYLEDPDVAVTIRASYKDEQLSFLLQDDILCKNLMSTVRCQIIPDESLQLPQNPSVQCIRKIEDNLPARKLTRRAVKRCSHKSQEQLITGDKSAGCTDRGIKNGHLTEDQVTPSKRERSSVMDEDHCQNCDMLNSNEGGDQLKVDNVCDERDSDENCQTGVGLIDTDSGAAHVAKSNTVESPATSHQEDPLFGSTKQLDTQVLLNILQCNLCREFSNSLNGLKAHLVNSHGMLWDGYCKSNIVSLTKLNSDDLVVKTEANKTLCRWETLSQSNTRTTRLHTKQVMCTSSASLSCSYCDKTFSHRKSLNTHIRDVHGKNNGIEVAKNSAPSDDKLNRAEFLKEICDRSTEIAIQNDMLSEEDSSTICLVCEKVFTGTRWSVRARLPRHIEIQHQISLEKYIELLNADSAHRRMCLAQEITATEWNRKKEQKTQLLGERSQFCCTGCGRQYCAFNNLMKHIRMAHKSEDDFKKILLGAEEQGSAAYRPGMKAREQLEMTCVYCGVKRIGTCILKHLKNVHYDERTFKEELKRAAEEHTNRINEREKERKKKGPQIIDDDRTFACQYCGKQFRHRQARYRHSRFKCPENTDKCKKLWCRCGKGFLTKDTLSTHKIKCDKREKKFMCHLCGKMYGTASGLYIHKQTAHCDTVGGKYKQACEVCGKVFYRKQHYDRHIPKHSDERSCQCEICGKRFKTKEDIRKHQYVVHFHKYTYYCKDCGHGMNKLSYVKTHKCGRVRRQQDGTTVIAKKQEKLVKPEHTGNVIVTDQQVICEEPGNVSTDQLSVMQLSHGGAAVQEGISHLFQCDTAVPGDSVCVLQNALPMRQTITPATYDGSTNIQGMVHNEQEMELTIQNMVVHQVSEIQSESGQNTDAANLLEMATYDTLQMLPGNTDYPLLQGTTASVMIQQSSGTPSETVSLTALSPAVSQTISTSYTVPQTYQIVQNTYQ